LFCFLQTFRHGFPYQPTALAFDPIQRLLAIGTKNGSLRMYPLHEQFSINIYNLFSDIHDYGHSRCQANKVSVPYKYYRPVWPVYFSFTHLI